MEVGNNMKYLWIYAVVISDQGECMGYLNCFWTKTKTVSKIIFLAKEELFGNEIDQNIEQQNLTRATEESGFIFMDRKRNTWVDDNPKMSQSGHGEVIWKDTMW